MMNSNTLGRAFAILVTGGLAALAVAGCSNDGSAGSSTTGGGGPTYKYPQPADYCTALATAQCSGSVVSACYGSDPPAAADTSSCVAAASALSRCDANGLPYHPEAAEACVAAQQTALADAKLTLAEEASIKTACLPVFTKAGLSGDPCTTDTDCATGSQYRCMKNGTTSACAIPVTVSAGGKCSDPASVCAAGNYCEASGHCIGDPAVGEACCVPEKPGDCPAGTIPCDVGFRCGSATKTCIAKTANGQPCKGPDECAGGFCIFSTGSTTAGTCSGSDALAITSASCSPYK